MKEYNFIFKLQLKILDRNEPHKLNEYHEYFIDVEKDGVYLDHHPNLTDKIYYNEAYWDIEEINYNLEEALSEIKLHRPCSGMVEYKDNIDENLIGIRLIDEFKEYWLSVGFKLYDYFLGNNDEFEKILHLQEKQNVGMNDVLQTK